MSRGSRKAGSRTQAVDADESAGRRIELDDKSISELANEKHPLNVLVSEYDWQRSLEAARLENGASVSDVVRRALDRYLEQHPAAAHIRSVAEMALDFEVRVRESRNSLHVGLEPDSS